MSYKEQIKWNNRFNEKEIGWKKMIPKSRWNDAVNKKWSSYSIQI